MEKSFTSFQISLNVKRFGLWFPYHISGERISTTKHLKELFKSLNFACMLCTKGETKLNKFSMFFKFDSSVWSSFELEGLETSRARRFLLQIISFRENFNLVRERVVFSHFFTRSNLLLNFVVNWSVGICRMTVDIQLSDIELLVRTFVKSSYRPREENGSQQVR